ncbi:MAG: hypothetical protein AAFW70_18145 [Cyanobacteria bacterium J06635_10]
MTATSGQTLAAKPNASKAESRREQDSGKSKWYHDESQRENPLDITGYIDSDMNHTKR